ncbi:hypothetical protein [Hyalangium rubrum]|uniref:Lipoprotein n=1 Tax=Hyalangium rubrum TaxID=3103134 RepID=A0ABU5H5M9_9BACT|nr:hypothetical protein [Hyalangium sp. s54d21]MDY7227395.1 hypothetical protein [Hyalangium sp. s54d21]
MKSVRTWACVYGLAMLAACGDDETQTPDPSAQGDTCEAGQETCEVTQNITSDTTWTKDHTYVLKANVFVKNATLKIEPGTVIKGGFNTSLAITSTAKLDAQGTATAPIVFTSMVDVGSRQAGNWGGLVLLGKAPLNVQGGVDNIEGYPESADTQYGGSDAAHNCGTLKYARIEFAGYRLGGNNELNGLTLGGCGTATTVDYVQVHRGLDDGVEMFGGTANLKHIVVSLADDDGLDWDQGWTGKGQFIVVQQNRVVGNHGIEADNSSSSPNATPRSNPTLWNVTLIGSNRDKGSAAQTQGGAILRVGTAGSLNNAIVAYFNDFAIDIAGPDSIREATEDRLTVKNTTFWSTKLTYDATSFAVKSSSDGSDFNEWSKLGTQAEPTNTVVDPKLSKALYTAPSTATPNPVPDFKPETALAGGTPPADGFFDASATFRGAVGDTDWLAGWTAFPEL